MYAVAQLAGAATSIPVGRLFDLWGPRRTFTLGLIALGAGMALTSQATTLWHFHLGIGVIGGLGVVALGPVPSTALLSKWYSRNLTSLLGIAWAATGIGVLALAPVAQLLIDAFGWRGAYLALGLAYMVVPVLLAALPWSRIAAGRPDLEPLTARPARPLRLRSVMHHRAFQGLCAIQGLTALAMFAIHPQAVAMLVEAGIPSLVAATAFGVAGFAGFGGMLLISWAVDRISRIGAVLGSYLLSIVGMLALIPLLGGMGAWLVWVFVFTFGPTLGARGPVLAATVAMVFGRGRGLGAMVGAQLAVGSLGGALGTLTGGLLRDLSGGYEWTIAFAASVLLISPLIFCLIPELRQGRATAPPAD